MFRDYEHIAVGDTASLERDIREADIQKFVELTGDNNPLHVDRAYAEGTPYKDVVAHGMLGASFISTVIGTKLPGTGALWMSQSLEFRLPVRVGDRLTVSCTVVKKVDRERVLELDTKICNQHGTVVLNGKGRVRLLATTAPDVVVTPASRLMVAIVTGGSGGIGRAICVQLARAGYRVVVNYRSEALRAEAICDEIAKVGGEAIAVHGDIANRDDVDCIVDRSVRAFGGVSLLVNNASPRIQPSTFDQLKWREIQNHLEVQVKGAFEMCKAVVPLMRAQGYGKIINITSQVLDANPSPSWTAYAVGKSALATFSRYLASELGPSGITVNCVSPGMTDTAMIGDIPEKARLMIARQTPLRRLARPDDVAGAVAFLASPSADFITGETVRVNGGQVML